VAQKTVAALRISLIFEDGVYTRSQRLLPGCLLERKNSGPTFVLHKNSDNFHNTVWSKRRVRNISAPKTNFRLTVFKMFYVQVTTIVELVIVATAPYIG